MAEPTLFDLPRARKYLGLRKTTDPDIKFWTYVEKGQPNECWPWRGFCQPNGYGRFKHRRHRTQMAHRVAYLIAVGPIPDGYEIDHLCKNIGCVNPSHLEAVTPQENNRRSESRSAKNLRVTHCPKGHPYDGYNLVMHKDGSRRCRACEREYRKFWKRRKRLELRIAKNLSNI